VLRARDDYGAIVNPEFDIIAESGLLDQRFGEPDSPRIADPDQSSLHRISLLLRDYRVIT